MKPESSNLKIIVIWTIIFSIAMGFLEAAVVVYLRQLYYPVGFTFPLQSKALPALKIEFLREFPLPRQRRADSRLCSHGYSKLCSRWRICFRYWQ